MTDSFCNTTNEGSLSIEFFKTQDELANLPNFPSKLPNL